MPRTAFLLMLAASLGFAQNVARNDWLIVPGVRVGPIAARTTQADLRRIFGAANVKDGPVYLGEGFDEPGTIVFGSDPSRMIAILWDDPDTRRQPSSVYICPERTSNCRWHTAEGVTIGTNLKTVEKANGRAFIMIGFEVDYQGTVISWKGGKLDSSRGRLLIRLRPTRDSRLEDSVIGDIDVSSSDPTMQRLNPAVYEIFVEFAE